MVVSIVLGYVGFVLSVFIRVEVSVIGFGLLFGDYQVYAVIVTGHGLVMIFGFVMPVVLGGFINYMVPIIVGLPDMVLPRINCLSLWLFVCGASLVLLSMYVDEGSGIGWTLYPSLSCVDYHCGLSIEVLIFGVHLLGLSTVLNSVNVICTVHHARSISSSVSIGVLIIAVYCTSGLIVVVIPVLSGCITLVLLDRV